MLKKVEQIEQSSDQIHEVSCLLLIQCSSPTKWNCFCVLLNNEQWRMRFTTAYDVVMFSLEQTCSVC